MRECVDPNDGGAQRARSLRMLLIAALAQNVGTGCAFGGVGVSILALQERYDTSLGMAAMGLSLALLSMTACGPFIAGLLSRWGLRAVMATGLLTAASGYLALAFAPGIGMALAACGLLIGPGIALFGALPPAVLAGSWFPDAPGRAMGFVYLPLFSTLIPLAGVPIIRSHGLTTLYLALAAMHLLLLPWMLAVAEPAPRSGSERQQQCRAAGPVSSGMFLAVGAFWVIALGKGVLNGTSIASSALLMPIAKDYGISVKTGSVLLSLSGFASILGSLVAGYSADRVGPSITLAMVGIGLAMAWALIASGGQLPSLAAAAVLVGICGGSVFAPMSALAVELFGMQALPKVLGLMGIVALPFTSAMSPAAGFLRDLSGSYTLVIAAFITTCLGSASAFLALSQRRRTHSSP